MNEKAKIHQLLKKPIESGISLGEIVLGMSAQNFIDKFVKHECCYESEILKVSASFPKKFVYTFLESIRVEIDIVESKVVYIKLYNNYEGEFLKGVRIGDTIEKLKERNPTSEFAIDDDYIFVDGSTMRIVASEDLTSGLVENPDKAIVEEVEISRFWFSKADTESPPL